MVAAKEVITEGVKGGMAARAGKARELWGETGEVEFVSKGQVVGWGGQEVLGVTAGEGAERKAGGDAGVDCCLLMKLSVGHR